MTAAFSLPETYKIIQMAAAQESAGGTVTSDYISLKNAHKAWIIISFATAGNAETFTPLKATAVAPTNSTAITKEVKIWSNLATATSDTLVERTAATTYACDNGATSKLIIFEIDPADLGDLLGVPYDCIAFSTTALAANTDYLSALCILQMRYGSQVSVSPSSITD